MKTMIERVPFLMNDNIDPLKSSWCVSETIYQREIYFEAYYLYKLSSVFDSFRKINIQSENFNDLESCQINGFGSIPLDPTFANFYNFHPYEWFDWYIKEKKLYYNEIFRVDLSEMEKNVRLDYFAIHQQEENIAIVTCNFVLSDTPPFVLFYIHSDGTIFWERYFKEIEFNPKDKFDKNRIKHDVVIPYYKGKTTNPCCIDLYNLTQNYVIKSFKRKSGEHFTDLRNRVHFYANRKLDNNIDCGIYNNLSEMNWFDWSILPFNEEQKKRNAESMMKTANASGSFVKERSLCFENEKEFLKFLFPTILHEKGGGWYCGILEVPNTNSELASVQIHSYDGPYVDGLTRLLFFQKDGTIYWNENCNCKKIEEESVYTDDLPF